MWPPVEPITLLTPATQGSGRGREFAYRLCRRGAALSGRGGDYPTATIEQALEHGRREPPCGARSGHAHVHTLVHAGILPEARHFTIRPPRLGLSFFSPL